MAVRKGGAPRDPPGHDQEKLELEAFRAVSGGDYVRQRLLHGLALGAPSVDSAAYVVKSRVKRVDSLILKVLDRRKAKPAYRPFDARDIVGLRLLTLFRNELPLLVRRFMDFVETSQRDGLGIFVGKAIKDAILEIRIYGASQRRDPNMELCIRELMDFGFALKRRGKKLDEVQIEIDHKESQYSSIHIVLLAEGPSGLQRDRVPIEVQLRTSLEDVWGEIDHRIVYSEKTKTVSPDDELAEEAISESMAERVRSLKTLLDACSQAADTIENDINRHAPSMTLPEAYQPYVSIGLDQLKSLPVTAAIAKKILRATETLIAFSATIYGLSSPGVKPDNSSLLTQLGEATHGLEVALVEYLTKRSRSLKKDRTIRYRVGMEIALCYYWQAVLLRDHLRPPTVRGVMDNWKQAIRRSIGEYLKLATEGDFSQNPVLAFRLANAIDFQGHREYALSNYRLAHDYLARDIELEPTHYLRIRIPRQYGFALWQVGNRLEEKSVELGDRSFSWPQERDYYLQALDVTLPVHGQAVTGGEFDRSTKTTAEESAITANNIIYYALCFLDCGGSWEELEKHGVTRLALRGYIDEVIPNGLGAITRVSFADTIRQAAKYLGDTALMKKAARRMIELRHTKDLTVPLSEFMYRKMLREARRDLRTARAPRRPGR